MNTRYRCGVKFGQLARYSVGGDDFPPEAIVAQYVSLLRKIDRKQIKLVQQTLNQKLIQTVNTFRGGTRLKDEEEEVKRMDCETYNMLIEDCRSQMVRSRDRSVVSPKSKPPKRVRGSDGKLLPPGMHRNDLRGKRILVPGNYWGGNARKYYVGQVTTWTTFVLRGDSKTIRGYKIYYPLDKKTEYMIEDETHDFFDPDYEWDE